MTYKYAGSVGCVAIYGNICICRIFVTGARGGGGGVGGGGALTWF